ncbi:MAG: hypothetical protein ACMUJM_25425 [bacterium]
MMKVVVKESNAMSAMPTSAKDFMVLCLFSLCAIGRISIPALTFSSAVSVGRRLILFGMDFVIIYHLLTIQAKKA